MQDTVCLCAGYRDSVFVCRVQRQCVCVQGTETECLCAGYRQCVCVQGTDRVFVCRVQRQCVCVQGTETVCLKDADCLCAGYRESRMLGEVPEDLMTYLRTAPFAQHHHKWSIAMHVSSQC